MRLLWIIPHLSVVAELIAFLFTLMGADQQLQVVPVQKVLCDVRTPVATPAPHLIWDTALWNHGVTPEQV